MILIQLFKFFINIQKMNVIVTNSTLFYSSLLGFNRILISEYFILIKKQNCLFCLAKNSNKEITKLAKTMKTIFENQVKGLTIGFVAFLKTKERAFRFLIKNSKFITVFSELSHASRFMVPSKIEINLINKQQISLFSIDKIELTKFGKKIKSFFSKKKGKGIYFYF